MKMLTVLFSVAIYLAVIDLSHADAELSEHHDHHKQNRHRLKRQYQNDYYYQYHPSWYRPHYPEERRDDRNQQDLLPAIYRLLEEISEFVRRPPPPPPPPQPQPIYIPYPVQCPLPHLKRCKCAPQQSNGTINVGVRFPEMEDDNQNWGYDDSLESEDEYDNSRPINFDPVLPLGSTSRPPPSVDHGSSQASIPQEEKTGNAPRRPRRCDAVVLSCCDPRQPAQKQRMCFDAAKCTYNKPNVCSHESVQEVLRLFASSYAPSN